MSMYYGWLIVLGVFLVQMFQVGFTTYAFGLLVVPMQEDFGVGRAEVMYGMTASTIAGLVLSPILGPMVDKRPLRVLMSIGALALAGGLFAMAASTNIWVFSAVFGISMSLGNLLLSALTASTTISRWFTAKRGRALGIAAIGTSVGGVLVPALLGYWIETEGWRASLQYLGWLVLLLLLPFLALVMHSRPADKGLAAPGANTGGAAAPVVDQHFSTGDVLRNREFWLIGISLGLLFAVYSATMSHLPAYAAGLGVDTAGAGQLVMVVAICGFVGKLLFGFAADRISLKLGLWVAQLLVVIAMVLLAAEGGVGLMVLAAACMGLAAGGMLPVWGAMLAVVFGTVSYGRVMGLMNPVIILLVMPSYTIAGLLYDLSNSYTECFLLFIAILVVSAGLLAPARITPAPAPIVAAAAP